MQRRTKYIVIFEEDPLNTLMGPHDNALFHNIEDMKASFEEAKSVYVDGDKLIITDFRDHKVIGQIHKVKSFL